MFMPITKKEAQSRGIDRPDFIIVTGDAYVDHPSFGTAIIGRVLEDAGFSVCIIPQPDWKSTDDFKRFGKPRLAFLVNGGNIDSMVAHYTVALKKRSDDAYSPGGKAGKRPDRAVIVYCNRIREAYGDVPIIIGGIEASTRRFAHYDYWTDSVRRSILVDSRADLLSYGMGENITRRIAFLLDKGVPIRKIHDVRGSCYLTNSLSDIHYDYEITPDYDKLKTDKRAFVEAFDVQYRNQDAISGKAVVEPYGDKYLVQNPPMFPLEREELDRVYAYPYERAWHPDYDKDGGVPGISEVKFSITHCRGCFGACNFCSIAFHQGRVVTSRSEESVLKEVETLTKLPDFKGYIHDVGGPTANFRHPACEKQKKSGACTNRKCLFPKPCPSLNADHSEYVRLLEKVSEVKGVKKVFIRSGIRFDYMLADKSNAFFKRLVSLHTGGQLKVAPEHCSDNVLKYMGKPSVDVYKKFSDMFYKFSDSCHKEQYLVPYLMSSHPGATLDDAIELALFLKQNNQRPEQVQDFYPTPGTASTCMYFTETDPFTFKKVFVEKTYAGKKLQRALLQYYKKENQPLIRDALIKRGKSELIGFGDGCLVPPAKQLQSKKTDSYKSKNFAQNKNQGKKGKISLKQSEKPYKSSKKSKK